MSHDDDDRAESTADTRRSPLLSVAGLVLLAVGFVGLIEAQSPFGQVLAGCLIMSGAVIGKYLSDLREGRR